MKWIFAGAYGWPETHIARTEDFPELQLTSIWTRGLDHHVSRVELRDKAREDFWLQIVGSEPSPPSPACTQDRAGLRFSGRCPHPAKG